MSEEIHVGQNVIKFHESYRGDPVPQIVKVESVAPKSFVIAGDRYQKDKMERRFDSGFYGTRVRVATMTDRRAPYLPSLISRNTARTALSHAELAWRRNETVENAADLQVALHEWVTATQQSDRLREALRALPDRSTPGPHKDILD